MALREGFPWGVRGTWAIAVLLGFGSLLSACSAFDDTSGAPAAPITGCEEQAKALGFQVVQVGETQATSFGDFAPVLVNWGRNGGVHLVCRRGPDGTVTLG
ncbi:MAG TPA: hypothetical protein VLX09_07220 [Stellaceae bacterium]|nr:hypothetical protein [Stellaceae bacterium]